MNRAQTTLAAAVGVVTIFTTVVVLRTRPETLLPQTGQQSYVPQVQPARGPASTPEIPPICTAPYRAVCQKRGITRDPTGTVLPDVNGEISVLRTYEEIVRAHPNWSVEQVDHELAEQIYTVRRRERILAAHAWVIRAIEDLIERQTETNLTKKEKNLLIKRLRRVEVELPPPVSLYADEPDLITRNDVFYERLASGRMRLRVGGAYLMTAKSWYNVVFTMAHELAHAIDPCEIRSQGYAFPAYDRLSACFLSQGTVASRKNRSECGLHDQLSETFADWVAVQISADALAQKAAHYSLTDRIAAATNSVRDLCVYEEDPGVADTDHHPAPEVRIEKIFALNPKIRETLECGRSSEETPYCDFDFLPR